MAEPDPGYEAQEGTAEQLPRGEAQALNENTNVEAPEPIELPAAGVPGSEEDVEFTQPDESESFTTGDKDEDDFLFGDPDPSEYDDGTGPAYGPLSREVIQALPALIEASRDPSSPPQLTMLVKLLQSRLGL